jgi:hypothetical protein
MKVGVIRRATLVVVFVAVSVSGCTVKMPEAATVPPGELATLSFSRGTPEVDIRSITLDGHALSWSSESVQVAPGPHSVSLSYAVTVTDMCDGIQERCPTTITRGSCSGGFTLATAEQAVVALNSSTGEMQAFVRPPWKFGDLFADAPAPKARLTCSSTERAQGSYTRSAM